MRATALRVFALVAVAAGPLSAQRPVVIAVLPFEDRGSYGQDKEVFRALELGIPATLMGELSGHPQLHLAERARVAQALRSQGLGPNSRVDAATAAKVGKDLGARYAISGNFSDFYGKVRLDARIVDTETGQIVKVVSNDDPTLQDRGDLYRSIQLIAHRVLAETSRQSPPSGNLEGPNIPTEALSQFSLGLLYENRGERAKAGEHYQRALSVLPDYGQAREGIQRVR